MGSFVDDFADGDFADADFADAAGFAVAFAVLFVDDFAAGFAADFDFAVAFAADTGFAALVIDVVFVADAVFATVFTDATVGFADSSARSRSVCLCLSGPESDDSADSSDDAEPVSLADAVADAVCA